MDSIELNEAKPFPIKNQLPFHIRGQKMTKIKSGRGSCVRKCVCTSFPDKRPARAAFPPKIVSAGNKFSFDVKYFRRTGGIGSPSFCHARRIKIRADSSDQTFHPRSPGADENATPVAQFFATAAERERSV
jgi:hypothetical protein